MTQSEAPTVRMWWGGMRNTDTTDLEARLLVLRTEAADIGRELMRRREEGARQQHADRAAYLEELGPGSLSRPLTDVKWP